MKFLHERLKKARKRKGLTQREASERLQVSLRTLQHYEQGTINPSLGVLLQFMEFYNSMDYNELLNGVRLKWSEDNKEEEE